MQTTRLQLFSESTFGETDKIAIFDKNQESYSKFAQEGTEAIKIMTGFLISEFMELYSLVEKSLKVTGRGKKPKLDLWIHSSLLWSC